MSPISKSTISVFYVPCASEKEAETIAERLLDERLIACAQIFPQVRSLYVWEGRLEKTQESILIIKTTILGKPRLLKRLSELHSYTCPCFLELEPRSINSEYAAWLSAQVLPEQGVLQAKREGEKEREGVAEAEADAGLESAIKFDDDPPPWD